MQQLNDFIESLHGNQFDINYDDTDSSVTVLENSGAFQLEFLVNYSTKVVDYDPGDYETPEHYRLEYKPNFVDEIVIYTNTGMIELTQSQIIEIENIITESLF